MFTRIQQRTYRRNHHGMRYFREKAKDFNSFWQWLTSPHIIPTVLYSTVIGVLAVLYFGMMCLSVSQ